MTLESIDELSFTPRDYQTDAAVSILKSITEDKKRSTVLLLPTGMGKTNVAVMVVVGRYLRNLHQKIWSRKLIRKKLITNQ